MRDHFAELGFERGPVINGDALKARFQELSGVAHPDRGGSERRFRELNAAYHALREPARRLRHLLELEAPELIGEREAPPAEVGELFMEVGAVVQKLGDLKKREASAGSELSRALLSSEKLALLDEVQSVLGTVESAQREAMEEVVAIGSAWRTALPRLAALQRKLSFYRRWAEQLREGMMGLS